MKNIFLIIFSFIVFDLSAQTTISNNATFKLNSFKWSWLVSDGDTAAVLYPSKVSKWFGPLEYGGGYTFNSRSLVDKNYVDSVAAALTVGTGSTYVFQSGLTKITDTVRLGGTLTQNTIIDNSSSTYDFDIKQGSNFNLHVDKTGYVSVGTNSSNSGYKFHVGGTMSAASGTGVFYFNGGDFYIRNTGSSMPLRMFSNSFEWRINSAGSDFSFQPFTNNTANWSVRTYSNSKILEITTTNSNATFHGGLSIGSTTLDASSQVQINSTTKGFLPPRMTEAQKNAISSPAEGLMIYQTDGTKGWYGYNGTAWVILN
jgi:hypothetical protein